VDLLKAQQFLDNAEHNIRLVKLGHGVHNVNYSTALLNMAVEDSAKVVGMLGSSTQPAKVGVAP
jgi:hypothetical protein